jgi:hypothetical protein
MQDSNHHVIQHRRVTIIPMPDSPALKLSRAMVKSRVGKALFVGVRTAVVSFLRTFYVLWLQVTGVLFAVFTVMGGHALFREYRAGTLWTDHQNWVRIAGTLMCGWFTLVSFVRAQRTNKK